jgi:hypothetical protein
MAHTLSGVGPFACPDNPQWKDRTLPNHVTNVVRANRDVIHAMLNEGGVDFNRIIPMPETVIRGSIGHAEIDGVYQKVWYPDEDPQKPMERTKPQPYPEGATDWYDWSIEHWGTKWNAYSSEVLEDDTIAKFDTAWSHPYPVMAKLAEMFPKELIQVMYADEDLGNNFGVYGIIEGLFTDFPCPDEGTEDAVDLACLIKYGCHYKDLHEDDAQCFTCIEVLRHALHAGSSHGS